MLLLDHLLVTLLELRFVVIGSNVLNCGYFH